MVGVAAFWPSVAIGGSCSEFPWHYPRDMVMPHLIQEGQKSIAEGDYLHARELFSGYLLNQKEGVFAEGAKWVVAWLPGPSDESGKEFLAQIQRLQTMTTEQPNSVYAPWALCSIGQLYWDAGWHSEANALFEEFLGSYPEHPLAGSVMVEAGMGYLENRQFLEAALILRRVVEEPKWEAYRSRGALGLADATAMSKAWKQAYYWYRVVEVEHPELIRESERSSYYFGLAELAVGDSQKSISRLLTTINLHPEREMAGKAFNRISEKLFNDGYEFLSLWFAEQAKQRFKGQEPGRQALAAQTRWVVEFLSQDHTKEEWVQVYRKLDDLDIYLSVSWDHVVETARLLSQAPEQELVEESLLWLGRGYLMLEDIPAAIQSLKHLAIVATIDAWRHEARERLSTLLHQQLHALFHQKAWVGLLKFHEDQQEAFRLVPLTRERVKVIAQAYQQINLPLKAMQWYDQLLKDHPASPLREEIFAKKVLFAEDQSERRLVQKAGARYMQEYPEGHWRVEVSTALGMAFLRDKKYLEAIRYFTDVLSHAQDQTLQRYILRNRSLAYQEVGRRDLALQDLQKVVTLSPVDMANITRLGDFLFDQGDYEDAERLYDQVLSSTAPVSLKAWAKYRWGLSLNYQGNDTEAEKILAEVGQLETQSPEFENTIRAAAVAVLDEFSLNEKAQVRRENEK